MRKNPLVFIHDILECIERIAHYTEGLSIKAFLEDQLRHDAAIRRIEIIGEAARNIPESIKKKYPEINWSDIIGTRNMLIHEYSRVDLERIWSIATKDVKILKKQMLKIKKDLEKGD